MSRRGVVDVIAGLKPVLIALAASALVFSAFGCGGDPPPPADNDDEPEVGDECDEEGETHNGLICEDGVWVEEEDPECTPETVEEDCDEDQICEDGQCVDDEQPECTPETVEEDCDEDQICEDGQCVDDEQPECTPETVEEDCDEDQICEDGQCVDDEEPECTPETVEEDCDEDQICEDGQCVDDEDPSCDVHFDCAEDEVCEDDECTDDSDLLDCSDDGECPAGYDCEDDSCVATQLECEADPDFFGQIGTDLDDVPNSGGTPTSSPFSEDAGVEEVRTFIADEFDELDSGDTGGPRSFTPDDPIEIDGAIVTAVEHVSDSFFWVEDSEAGVYVRLGDGVDPEPNVGDEVSFDVEEAGTFNADPQVTEISNWEVDDSDQEVSYTDVTDGIDIDDQYARNIRVGAEIQGDSSPCGGDQFCYDVVYGEYGQFTSEFRFYGEDGEYEDPYDEGDCMTFTGPLMVFPGFHDPDETPASQLDSSPSVDHAWHSVESSDDD